MEDPISWIHRVEQFFAFQQTEEAEKLPLATYHLEGEVQMRYQLFRESEELVTWEKLKTNLHTRYGPTPFENPFGELTKLRQTGLVKNYQLQVEQLVSRVGKLSPQHQLSCFVSRLKDTIRTEVQAARPTLVIEAIGLARLFEGRNWNSRKHVTVKSRHPHTEDPVPPLPSAALSRSKNPAVRRLTPMEMQDQRTRRLCFNCDEKFILGHRCKKLFLIEGLYSEEDDWGNEEILEQKGALDDEPVISLRAITGSPTPSMMRVKGRLGNNGITSFMDSGSTHNFRSTRWADKVGLKPNHTGRLQVIVANGERLECRGLCKGLLLWMQGETFVVDFFFLALEGNDVVLGTQWFQTLGPIFWDFGKLWMKFWWKGKEVELRGLTTLVHRVVEEFGCAGN